MPKKKTILKSAKSGKIVSKKFAEKNKATTFKQTVKSKPAKQSKSVKKKASATETITLEQGAYKVNQLLPGLIAAGLDQTVNIGKVKATDGNEYDYVLKFDRLTSTGEAKLV